MKQGITELTEYLLYTTTTNNNNKNNKSKTTKYTYTDILVAKTTYKTLSRKVTKYISK
jgi:hypothetical protein